MTAYGALGALLLLILLPGFGISFALYRPGELRIAARLALALALGYGVSALISYLLVLAGAFYAVPAFALVGAATTAAWAVAWRRAPLVSHLRSVRLTEARNDPSTVVGLAVIAAIGILAHGSITTFRARIPYRYWVDGMQISRLHEIPGGSIHYGDLYPTVSSKVLLDAFTALVNGAISEPQLAVGPLLWICIVGTAVALFAFAREAGLRTIAPLVPVLAIANPYFLGHELTRDLGAYRAETLGRVLAVTALAFGVRALRDRRRMDVAVAAVALTASAGTHLVPTLVVCILLAGFALGRIAVDRSRAGLTTVLRRGALIASGALVGYGLILAAPTRTGFGGPSAASEYRGYPDGFDPTAFLASGAMKGHPATEEWYRTPRQVLATFLADGLGTSRVSGVDLPVAAALALGCLTLAVFLLLRVERPIRYLPLACWAAAAASILVALFFARRYQLHTLGTFGMRRLFDYAPLLFILGGAAVLEIALRALGRVRSWTPAAAGLALTLVVAGVVLAGYAAKPRADDARALPLLSWIRTSTPCDARLVANTRTVGVFQALTGRISVTEGMGPFLRPVMLRRIVGLLLDTRRFYQDPTAERDFLVRHGVDYVLIVRHLAIGHQQLIGQFDQQAFKDVPFLERIKHTHDFTAYRVAPEASAPKELPQRFPCETAPLR